MSDAEDVWFVVLVSSSIITGERVGVIRKLMGLPHKNDVYSQARSISLEGSVVINQSVVSLFIYLILL